MLHWKIDSCAFLVLSLILVAGRLYCPIVSVTLLLVLLEILANHPWLLRTTVVDMDRYSYLLDDRSL